MTFSCVASISFCDNHSNAFQRQSIFAHIESDYSTTISLAKSTKPFLWYVTVIIEDIRSFAYILGLSFYFISKFFNAFIRSIPLPTDFLTCPSCILSSILRCDYGWTHAFLVKRIQTFKCWLNSPPIIWDSFDLFVVTNWQSKKQMKLMSHIFIVKKYKILFRSLLTL